MFRKTHVILFSLLFTVLAITVQAVPAQLTSKSQPSGTSIFLLPVAYQSGGQADMSVAVADINGDGNQDIVVSNACPLTGCSNTEALGVLLGNGDGTFRSAVAFRTGGVTAYGLGTVAIADVNDDGKPDVMVTNACGIDNSCTSGSVGILLGNGDGTFQTAVTYQSGGYFDVSPAVADVNGDGKMDLVLANDCPDITCAGEGYRRGAVG